MQLRPDQAAEADNSAYKTSSSSSSSPDAAQTDAATVHHQANKVSRKKKPCTKKAFHFLKNPLKFSPTRNSSVVVRYRSL